MMVSAPNSGILNNISDIVEPNSENGLFLSQRNQGRIEARDIHSSSRFKKRASSFAPEMQPYK
jgi:hypothetical protein